MNAGRASCTHRAAIRGNCPTTFLPVTPGLGSCVLDWDDLVGATPPCGPAEVATPVRLVDHEDCKLLWFGLGR